jgi:hypothetical protein
VQEPAGALDPFAHVMNMLDDDDSGNASATAVDACCDLHQSIAEGASVPEATRGAEQETEQLASDLEALHTAHGQVPGSPRTDVTAARHPSRTISPREQLVARSHNDSVFILEGSQPEGAVGDQEAEAREFARDEEERLGAAPETVAEPEPEHERPVPALRFEGTEMDVLCPEGATSGDRIVVESPRGVALEVVPTPLKNSLGH